jgi:hypothetical protein
MYASIARRTGYIALLAGVIGLLAVGLLVAALAAPTPVANSMRRETSLFAWQNGALVLQSLAMIPVTLGLHRLAIEKTSGRGLEIVVLGLVAQVGLVLASVLLFVNLVSDMLYMAPIGLLGLWLLGVNREADEHLTGGVIWFGRIAGLGLLAVGLGFLIYGIFVAPAVFVRPLTSSEIDAQSLTPANLVAHVCMAAGTLFGRVVYPIWTILLGRRLMRLV